MGVEYVWAGAGTDSSIWVRGKVTGASTRLAISESADLSSPIFFGPVAPTAEGIVSIEATGLASDTRFYYALEDDAVLDTDFSGTFRTHPELGSQASYTLGAAGDAGLTGAGDDSHITDAVSNNPVFDTLRARALDEEWVQFLHLGDLHYRDIATSLHTDYRAAYADTLTYNGTLGADARQGQFFRGVGMSYVWDDHDFGPNNSDRTHIGRQAAAEVYREVVPHYPLPAGDGDAPIYQSWQIGRVLFIASDVRWARDPNSDVGSPTKTMLGVEQKRWMEQVLRNSPAKALVWILPSMWLSDQGDTRNAGIGFSGADYASDSFRMFRHERDELVQLLGDTGWLDRMVCLQADKHALSMATGPGNPHGGFPLWMFASLDSSFSTNPEGQYDLGQSPGRQRYGTIEVVDSGHTIALHGTAYIGDSVWRTHTAYAYVEPHTLTLDYAAQQVFEPFEPVDDDQQVLNDFTAARTDGGQARFEQTDGPLSVSSPPDGVGRYPGSATLNVPSDDELGSQASWRVHKGTVDEARFPAIGQKLGRPELEERRTDIARLDVGDQVTVTNPPAWLPPEQIGVLVEGYEEHIKPHEWTIEYNASPASSAQVGQVAPETILTPNHSFEVHAEQWEPVGSTFARSSLASKRGTYAGAQQPDGTSETSRSRSRLEDSPRVYAGVEYQFSAWVYSLLGFDVDMSVQWFDGDGAALSFPFIQSATPIPAEEWTLLSAAAVAPEGAHSLRWNINQRPTPTVGDVLLIDEAIITDGADPGADQPNRADTSGAALVTGVGESDTTFLVHTTQDEYGGARWINSQGPSVTHESEFPFNLRLGGEVVQVASCEPIGHDLFRTARAADSWGSTEAGLAWTNTAVADTVIGTSTTGQYGFLQLTATPTTVRTQTLALEVGLADCEVLWSVRTNQTASGSSQLPSLILRHTGGIDFYRCRAHLNTDGTVSLSVTRGTTQVGDAVNLPLAYTPSESLDDRIFVRTRIIGHRILARAWRVDTTPAGVGSSLDTSYQEPHHWMIDREVEADTIAAGQIGFSASTFGSYTGVDPAMRFQLLEVVTPQRMVVERSLNTVVKTHAAGTAIALDRPADIGL